MYTPIHISASNFRSFKELEFEFCTGQTTLIQGKNLTDDGCKSNGSGKSSLFEAVYFAITGTTSQNIPVKKLIRRGEEEADVILALRNTSEPYKEVTDKGLYMDYDCGELKIDLSAEQINGFFNHLIIKRQLSSKGASKLGIWYNGEQIHFASINDGNKLIREKIGISLDDFSSFFCINRQSYKSFFKMSDTEKKEFIGRFSGAEKVKEVYPVIEKEINELGDKHADCYANIQEINVKILSLNQSIKQLQLHNQENDVDEQIFNIAKEILNCETEIDSICQKIDKLCFARDPSNTFDDQLSYYQSRETIFRNQIERLRVMTYDDWDTIKTCQDNMKELEEGLADINKEIEKLEIDKYILNKELRDIDNLLETSISCPNCGHQFSLQDENFDVLKTFDERDEIKDVIGQIDLDIAYNNQQKIDYKDNIDFLNIDLKKYNDFQHRRIKLMENVTIDLNGCLESKEKVEDAITETNRLISKYNNEIENLTEDIERKKKQIEDLKTSNPNEQIDKMVKENEGQLDDLVQSLKMRNLELDAIDFGIILKKKWLNEFKNFYSYLTNLSIKSIQHKCNRFLEQMKCDLQILIEPVTELASGDVREKINVFVIRNGEKALYDEYSAGEKSKCDLSCILTFQDIINSTCDIGKGLDMLCLDEVNDALDSEAQLSVVECLNNIKKTILLTSQVQIEEITDNRILIICKEFGISKILN